MENLYYFNFTFYMVAPAGNQTPTSFFWTDAISVDRTGAESSNLATGARLPQAPF